MKNLFNFTLLTLLLFGCVHMSDPQVTYNSFKTGEIAYKNGLMLAADLYKKGEISKEEKEEIISIANDYRAAYNIAAIAFATYMENPSIENKEYLDVLQRNANELLDNLKRWLYGRQES